MPRDTRNDDFGFDLEAYFDGEHEQIENTKERYLIGLKFEDIVIASIEKGDLPNCFPFDIGGSWCVASDNPWRWFEKGERNYLD